MSCHEIQSQLVELFDGRLDAASELRVHAHLEGCEACREHAATWSALVPAMRGLAPAPPTPLQQRRMEAQIERRLGDEAASPRRSGGRRLRVAKKFWIGASAMALAAIAVAAVLLSRTSRPPAFAVVTSQKGASSLDAGSHVALADGDRASIALSSGATIELDGVADLELGGNTAHVALRLTRGKIFAEVAHRRPEQTFTVEVPGGRIEVRGTRFTVFAGASASWVEVERGQVVVWDAAGGEQTIAAGGRHDFARAVPAPAEPSPAPFAASTQRSPPACTPVDCRRVTAEVREAMRRRDYRQALALINAAARPKNCSSLLKPCRDELGYLHAEAFRLAGQLDEAIASYKALDRDAAPPEMRQNALYAAAQLERRLGRLDAARLDYEAALSALPRGVLREDALLGAMDAAAEAADVTRARAAAGRYLAAFPSGLGAARARRIAEPARAPRETAP